MRMMRTKLRGRGGFTMIELMFAAVIGLGVMAAMMQLVLMVARDQRLGLVEQSVFTRADQVQDSITQLVTYSSANAGVFLATPDGAFFHRLVFRTAVGAANRELVFDPDDQTLTYDPNIAISNDHRVVARSEGLARLVSVRFRAATKIGGIPDSSVILVELEVSDEGLGRRSWRGDADEADWVTSTRSFSINLRGP